ncbi:hypothetical protein AX15_007405 [Amanita polypyramis BW_CC]|nr:hypothetical protein AX15_007405 [Amanita polypyramis BW_CC]
MPSGSSEPRTKMEITGEDIYWVPQPSSLANPLPALHNHFRVNEPPPDGHLFASRHGPSFRPLGKKFLSRINELLTKAKDAIQGHSIRIGSNLLRGMPFEALKVKGRWFGDTYTKYPRAHAEIMASFIQERSELQELLQHTIPPIQQAGNQRAH